MPVPHLCHNTNLDPVHLLGLALGSSNTDNTREHSLRTTVGHRYPQVKNCGCKGLRVLYHFYKGLGFWCLQSFTELTPQLLVFTEFTGPILWIPRDTYTLKREGLLIPVRH